jgi:hypothetical protein
LTRPCPWRGKLGDGTVGAVAAHTTDNYHHVAGFLRARASADAAHRVSAHGMGYDAADVDLSGLLDRLKAAKRALAVQAELDDQGHQVDALSVALAAH